MSYLQRVLPDCCATLAVALLLIFSTSTSFAQDEPKGDTPAVEKKEAAEEPAAAVSPTAALEMAMIKSDIALDTVWTMVAAFLVMWMQAGFALVETGLTRAKNAVNICMKNLLDYCFGSFAYWLVGFGIMFGAGNAFMGTSGFMLQEETQVAVDPATMKEVILPDGTKKMESKTFSSLNWTTVPLEGKFFFQLVFAATSATIVSGAMAERTKFTSYMAYSVIISLVIYPISGHWIWGGGWLATMGFWDFAGSTVVHSLGGWLSLAGALILGPRTGKYNKEGKAMAIPGHNLVYVCLGVFVLWLGWFGFNPGSTMGAVAGFGDIVHITCTTNAAGAIGGITALFTAKMLFKKWEATMALNGVLAGLVAITASCPWVSVESAWIIGAAAGVLVVFSVLFFEHIVKIDDPVGAISVHGVCGSFGTLCVGLFARTEGGLAPTKGLLVGGDATQFINQLIGVGSVFAWGVVTGCICFLAIKYTIGLRVTPEEEREGLDFGEHGNEAYHGFVTNE